MWDVTETELLDLRNVLVARDKFSRTEIALIGFWSMATIPPALKRILPLVLPKV
jgi:hypothetical protein